MAFTRRLSISLKLGLRRRGVETARKGLIFQENVVYYPMNRKDVARDARIS